MKLTLLVFLLAVPAKGEVSTSSYLNDGRCVNLETMTLVDCPAKPARRAAETTEVKVVGDKIQITYVTKEFCEVQTLSREAAVNLLYQLGKAINWEYGQGLSIDRVWEDLKKDGGAR